MRADNPRWNCSDDLPLLLLVESAGGRMGNIIQIWEHPLVFLEQAINSALSILESITEAVPGEPQSQEYALHLPCEIRLLRDFSFSFHIILTL